MYTIHVVAVNENGEGLGTREVTAKTYSDQPSEAPQNATLETASSTVSRHQLCQICVVMYLLKLRISKNL